MNAGHWLTPDGIELKEIIGSVTISLDGRECPSYPVMVRCQRTCATEYVDPPNWFERLLGITFAAKVLRAIDRVSGQRRAMRSAEAERRATCAGLAVLLGAERMEGSP